jgi:hypothetical protein
MVLAEGRVKGEVFAEFLRRLTPDASQPVFPIPDRHPIPRCRPARESAPGQEGTLHRNRVRRQAAAPSRACAWRLAHGLRPRAAAGV